MLEARYGNCTLIGIGLAQDTGQALVLHWLSPYLGRLGMGAV